MKVIYRSYELEDVLKKIVPKDIIQGFEVTAVNLTYERDLELTFSEITKEDKEGNNGADSGSRPL